MHRFHKMQKQWGPFLLRHLHRILLYPLISTVLAAAAWTAGYSMLEKQRHDMEAAAAQQATALAHQYALQLTNLIGQIDQITLSLSYQWRLLGKPPELQRQFEAGMFPVENRLFVSLVDADGMAFQRTSVEKVNESVADREYFQLHKEDRAGAGLLISAPVVGRFTHRYVIHFTRRVEAPAGQFAGLVSVSVEPSYLAPYVEPQDLRRGDFIAVRDHTGTAYARVTRDVKSPHFFGKARFALDGAEGLTLFPAEHFIDNSPRYVAWQEVGSTNLKTVVGISYNEALAPYFATRDMVYGILQGMTLFLSAFSIAAMALTARRQWRVEQKENIRRTLRMAVDNARDGFYMLRPINDANPNSIDFEIVDCNERGAEFAGFKRDQLIGRRFSSFISIRPYIDELTCFFISAMKTGYREGEFAAHAEGPLAGRWLHRKAVRVHDSLAVTIRDITEVKQHEEQMQRLENEDALTGMPSRTWLMRQMPALIAEARVQNTQAALLFIDLDNFRNVNEVAGHDGGDAVLKAAAERLQKAARPGDWVVRLGGDEFCVVLPLIPSRDVPLHIAQRIVQAFHQTFCLGSHSHVVHASLGMSVCPADGEDISTLLRHAEMAMYEAKAAGKQQMRLFDPSVSEKRITRLHREMELRSAIENDEFVLYYQPRVNTHTGELTSMEALVRWNQPERGVVLPGEFIGLAEEIGLIERLGEIVIEKACSQQAAWRAQGLVLVPVSINVAARQFSHSGLASVIIKQLQLNALPPSLLDIEVTESGIMVDDEDTRRNLTALQGLGVKLYIDDFGTGYASLSQLQRLRMDGLKVDRSFTAALSQTEEGVVFYRAIVSMARALGMTVVAEGVETQAEWQILKEMGCDEIQGFLMSRPLPAERVPQLLRTRMLQPV